MQPCSTYSFLCCFLENQFCFVPHRSSTRKHLHVAFFTTFDSSWEPSTWSHGLVITMRSAEPSWQQVKGNSWRFLLVRCQIDNTFGKTHIFLLSKIIYGIIKSEEKNSQVHYYFPSVNVLEVLSSSFDSANAFVKYGKYSLNKRNKKVVWKKEEGNAHKK
jgi:hypothetical protein